MKTWSYLVAFCFCAVAVSGQVLFEDDFEDGNAHEWTNVGGGSAGVTVGPPGWLG